jgi:hypothetical protein
MMLVTVEITVPLQDGDTAILMAMSQNIVEFLDKGAGINIPPTLFVRLSLMLLTAAGYRR